MHAALARAHCEKRRTTYVRTYIRTHVRTYVPTHPALCLGTSVPRQKACVESTEMCMCNQCGTIIVHAINQEHKLLNKPISGTHA